MNYSLRLKQTALIITGALLIALGGLFSPAHGTKADQANANCPAGTYLNLDTTSPTGGSCTDGSQPNTTNPTPSEWQTPPPAAAPTPAVDSTPAPAPPSCH